MTLCLDISQFVRVPVASGIQRVLAQIFQRLDGQDRAAFLVDGQVHLMAPSTAHELLCRPFGEARPGRISCEPEAIDRSLGRVPQDLVMDHCEAYVFAELTYERDVLHSWRDMAARYPDHVGAIFYDAAPELVRSRFGGQSPFGAGTYFRLMTELRRVACISHEAKRQLELLRGSETDAFDVVPLGGDHLTDGGHDEPARHFVVIGDLKAKKRVDVAIRGFQMLDEPHEHELVIIGREVGGSSDISELVDTAVSEDERITWLDDASDETVARLLRTARACVFVATDEGYGLPLVESLHAGTPVIVDSALPALRYVDHEGIITIDDVNASTVSTALQEIVGERSDELRAAARSSAVPTWDEYVQRLRSVFTPRSTDRRRASE